MKLIVFLVIFTINFLVKSLKNTNNIKSRNLHIKQYNLVDISAAQR
jgi:hypothetical protein